MISTVKLKSGYFCRQNALVLGKHYFYVILLPEYLTTYACSLQCSCSQMISKVPTEDDERHKCQSEEVVVDQQTQMIVEEFVQFKLRKAGKVLPRKSGPSDIE